MEILPGVHMVPGVTWSRVYLIDAECLALVDSGLPWSAGKVLRYIRAIGRDVSDLEYILMTHSHPDHTSGAHAIRQSTGAKIIAHEGDTRRHSEDEVSMDYLGVFGSSKIPLPFLRRTEVDRVVSEGDTLPVLGGLQVIHTPGHTPGSICYLSKDGKIVFTGDTAFSNGISVSRSIPFPGSDRETYAETLSRLASMDFDVLCGGHGMPLIGGASEKLRELITASPEPPTVVRALRNLLRNGIGRVVSKR